MCLCLFVERAGDTGGGGGGSTGPATADLVSDDDYGQSTDTELLFRCRICWKGFKHPMSLTLHKDLHTGQTRCPICQRIFSRSYDMKAHLLRIHKCTFSVDAKLNFRKWSPHEHIDTYCRDTVDRFIADQAKKNHLLIFFIRSNFFLLLLLHVTCIYYIAFFFIAQRYPIQSILKLFSGIFVSFFFSFLFFYTYCFYIFIVCISFFLYTYIYIYVVKPVNRHERFFAKIDRFSMILIRVKQTDIRRLEQSAINDRWREKSSSKRKTLF